MTEKKKRRVKLPNGSALYSSWYIPDGYTATGKIAAFKPTPGERRAFWKLEDAWLADLPEISRSEVAEYAAKKRKFRTSCGGYKGYWDGPVYTVWCEFDVVRYGFAVAQYDYKAHMWMVHENTQLFDELTALLPRALWLTR